MLDFFKNKASLRDIEYHLQRVSPFFIPELSSYVNIPSYSQKIAEKACRIEVWDNNNLVGLLAYYINIENKSAYITNVSVENNYSQHGVAQHMMDLMVDDVKGRVLTIRLEVNVGNTKAISFYKRNGFVDTMREEESCFMEKSI